MNSASIEPCGLDIVSGCRDGKFGFAYQALVRMMPCVGFMLTRHQNEEWQISFIEEGITLGLGFDPSLQSGRVLSEGFSPEFKELLIPSLDKILAGESRSEFIYQPTIEAYSVQLQALQNLDNTVVVGIISDITELLLAERRKKALAESGLVLYCLWRGPRQNWCFDRISPSVRAIGYQPEDFATGRINYTELIHSEDLEQVISTVKTNFEAGNDSFRMVYRLIGSDGVIRWVHDMTCEMRNHKGEVFYSDSVIVDITVYKHLEEKLRVSEERYTLAVEGANDGLWDWDIVRNYTYRSPRYMEILGYIEDLPPNLESAGDLIHPDDRLGADSALQDHLRGRTPYFQVEYRALSARDGYKWLFVRGKAILNDAGEAIRIAGSVTDISERKHTEEQLKYLSLHDSLTRLFNRGVFERAMDDINSQGKYSSTGVIVCDIDGLKLYNDILGHQVGDTIIVAATEVIVSSLRQGDIAARIGGDEFGILLSDVDSANVSTVVSRIREAIEDYNQNSKDLILSMSIGWSQDHQNTSTINDIFKKADDNMYLEKRTNYQTFRSLLSGSFMRKLNSLGVITADYSNALSNLVNEFVSTIDCSIVKRVQLELAAKFLDIGMVTASPRIPLKPGTLSSEETVAMQMHAERGYHIALVVPELQPVAELIRCHHEWWNGQGYPHGLKGTEISWECRVLHLTAAFNAMVHDRPYRKALSVTAACQEVLRCCGTQFDPELGEQFCRFIQLK